jgi:hypothetical protein
MHRIGFENMYILTTYLYAVTFSRVSEDGSSRNIRNTDDVRRESVYTDIDSGKYRYYSQIYSMLTISFARSVNLFPYRYKLRICHTNNKRKLSS